MSENPCKGGFWQAQRDTDSGIHYAVCSLCRVRQPDHAEEQQEHKPSAKVIRHPSIKRTPEAVLREILDRIDAVDQVAIVVRYKDSKEYAAGWSEQMVSDLALASMTLEQAVRDGLFTEAYTA